MIYNHPYIFIFITDDLMICEHCEEEIKDNRGGGYYVYRESLFCDGLIFCSRECVEKFIIKCIKDDPPFLKTIIRHYIHSHTRDLTGPQY